MSGQKIITGLQEALIAAKNPEGFTPELEAICADTCAEFGDPPCHELPNLVDPCEHITPCAECLTKLETETQQ